MFYVGSYTPPVTSVQMILLCYMWNKLVVLCLCQGPLPGFDEAGNTEAAYMYSVIAHGSKMVH